MCSYALIHLSTGHYVRYVSFQRSRHLANGSSKLAPKVDAGMVQEYRQKLKSALDLFTVCCIFIIITVNLADE